jgi:uncharacterized caspase-like protein
MRRVMLASLGVAIGVFGARGVTKADSGERLALVIGNAAYSAAPLKNPANDARAMASALREIGFEVIERADLEFENMLAEVESFLVKGRDSRVRLFYYAGHGTQFRGKNYLLPVKAVVRTEEDLDRRAVNATDIFERLAITRPGISIAIVDACRDVPFPLGSGTRTRALDDTKNLPTGFAPVAPGQGTLIAFSTAPGKIAFDGQGMHSTYTKHLLAHIKQPGLPIEGLLKRVRTAVLEDTSQRQVPWETSSLVGDFCFVPGGAGACSSGAASMQLANGVNAAAEPPVASVGAQRNVPPPKGQKR